MGIEYLSRPHAAFPPEDGIKANVAWYGKDLEARREEWMTVLSKAQQRDVVGMVKRTAVKVKQIKNAKVTDFEWPESWMPLLKGLLHGLDSMDGLGFKLIRGFPVELLSDKETELFFWGLGLKLGTPGEQNNQGDVVGHVMDTKADKTKERLYKTNAAIGFHCDSADVVGLLCTQQAKSGGRSRIASSVTVFNELLKVTDDLWCLFKPVPVDLKGMEGVKYANIRPCSYDSSGFLRTFYHSDYMQSVYRHDDVPPKSAELEKVMDAYEEILARPDVHLEMEFLKGDIQLINNHLVVHSRTEYEDDTTHNRHLLRLWLVLNHEYNRLDQFYHVWDKLQVLANFGMLKMKSVLHKSFN